MNHDREDDECAKSQVNQSETVDHNGRNGHDIIHDIKHDMNGLTETWKTSFISRKRINNIERKGFATSQRFPP